MARKALARDLKVGDITTSNGRVEYVNQLDDGRVELEFKWLGVHADDPEGGEGGCWQADDEFWITDTAPPIHDESAHDLLADHDLIHHLPDFHGRFPAEILAGITHPQQVRDELAARGMEPTTPDDAFDELEPWQCDALRIWHEHAHDAAERTPGA